MYKMEKDNQTNTLPNPLLNNLDNVSHFGFYISFSQDCITLNMNKRRTVYLL